MSYSVREIGEPSTVATGAGAALSGAAAGAAACWPFPHAVSKTAAMAVTMDARVQGVLKNWVICFLYAKKKRLRPKANAPGGGSLALNGAFSPIFHALASATGCMPHRITNVVSVSVHRGQ